MKRILSYIGVGMLLLSVMTACEEDAALLNPDVDTTSRPCRKKQ